uniref:Uncharacterized protein n=1 Tax=Rhizophora mucronata TaxID=61149 RepID=A0A2P2NUN8_RHIMU
MILEAKDGIAGSIDILTTRISISLGDTPDLAKSFGMLS